MSNTFVIICVFPLFTVIRIICSRHVKFALRFTFYCHTNYTGCPAKRICNIPAIDSGVKMSKNVSITVGYVLTF